MIYAAENILPDKEEKPLTLNEHFSEENVYDLKKNTVEYNPYSAMTDNEMLEKLEKTRNHAKEGRYREADAVVSDMRSKYG